MSYLDAKLEREGGLYVERREYVRRSGKAHEVEAPAPTNVPAPVVYEQLVLEGGRIRYIEFDTPRKSDDRTNGYLLPSALD